MSVLSTVVNYVRSLFSNAYGYDIETYPDIFTCSVIHAETGQEWFFEISDERNDLEELRLFLNYLRQSDAVMIGFNNLGFDYIVIHMIANEWGRVTPFQIYLKAAAIIKEGSFQHMVWPNDHLVKQWDLFKIHHFDNMARSTSLKIVEFNMRSYNIEDLPFEPGMPVGRENYPVLREYNKHDVRETIKFAHQSVDAIRMRAELSERYGKDFSNHNDTKIGKDYFIMRLEESGIECFRRGYNGREPIQTLRPQIALNDVIFDYIRFEQPEFNRILNHFKSQVITETKGVFKDLTASVDGFNYDFGVGGIHGSVDSQIVRADSQDMIIDIDVASYYPNLAIANRLYPEHLSDRFCDIYIDVYNQRKATDKKSPENAMLKLALNGVYGDSNNKYSPFYDPAYTMAITINGQLLLCMLAEQLIKIPDLKMIQINTDGLTVKVNRAYESTVNQICGWWEKFTLLTLELVEYKAMYIRDVNNYIGEYTDGKLKRKGAYAYDRNDPRELPYHKNHSALIVPMAAEAALVRGENIETFVASHNDIMDFMSRAKIPRSSKLVGVNCIGAEISLENTQRYYVSQQGYSLIKIMPPLKKKPDVYRRIGIDVGWECWPCNNLDQVTRPINYSYYIQQAEKLVKPLTCTG